MSAIPLTVFLSLALAGLFTLLFWREQRRRGLGGAERDSLLPLADESPRMVPADARAGSGRALTASPAPVAAARPGRDHDHDHAEGACGCRDGLRPPCAGCRRHAPANR